MYYGGDLYDSEDSDWDDPYEIASAAYVEDYNFDVPERMDLMVHERRRGPYSSDIRCFPLAWGITFKFYLGVVRSLLVLSTFVLGGGGGGW